MTKFLSLKTDGKGPTLTKQIAKICPKTQKAKALQSKWQKYDLKTDDQGPTFKKTDGKGPTYIWKKFEPQTNGKVPT